jgi:hypothetical protein
MGLLGSAGRCRRSDGTACTSARNQALQQAADNRKSTVRGSEEAGRAALTSWRPVGQLLDGGNWAPQAAGESKGEKRSDHAGIWHAKGLMAAELNVSCTWQAGGQSRTGLRALEAAQLGAWAARGVDDECRQCNKWPDRERMGSYLG